MNPTAGSTLTADQLQWWMLNNGGIFTLFGLILAGVVACLGLVILGRTIRRATHAA